jgi:hypothetical protein
MARVVIHGGMHKTGTTSVQLAFARNRDELTAYGVAYPGQSEQHGVELNAMHPGWRPAALLQLVEEGLSTGADLIFLSGEVVSTLPDGHLRRLTECLAGHDLTYVFCFRHWRGYLPSRWAQYCRRRDSQSFEQYLQRVLVSDHVDHRFDLVLFRAIVSGPCKVVALSYDNAIAQEGDIVPAVLRAASVPDSLIAKMRSDNWSHVTLDYPGRELCRLINGVIAERVGLPQDDLYYSVLQGRVPVGLFDPIVQLHELQDELNILVAPYVRHNFAEGWEPPAMEALVRNYSHLFANRSEEALFPRSQERHFSYSKIVWSEMPAPLGSSVVAIAEQIVNGMNG